MATESKALIRVGQVGCGYWGPNLLRNLQSSPKCSLVAVAEASPQRRSFVATRFSGAKLYSNFYDLIDDPSIEAVVIATPAATHFTVAEAALQAGKHVLVEKPMATSTAEVDALSHIADRRGLVLMVGHTFIYNDAVRRLKAIINEGELGEIVYLYSQRLNLGQLRSDVNAWWNLAPHDVSIQLFLVGEPGPQSASATGRAFLQPDIEDVVVANLVWRNGIVGTIHVSWLDPHKTRQLTVVGTRKMIVYDDVSEHKLAVYEKGFDRVPRLGERMDFDSADPPQFKPRQGAITMPYCPVREPLSVEIEHFLDCIAAERVPDTGAKHARAVIGILEAAQASLK
ncbi:MAG: Gfo/Idh/MocA family oxidoreductase, partial [Acetobacteraceae bacterium]|nr:Gfo/Idh/MocA family oxidoreductase [Acetobacteraceae bacterium]